MLSRIWLISVALHDVSKMSIPVYPDKNDFIALATTKMPLGKYKNVRLVGSSCHRYRLADYFVKLGAEYMKERSQRTKRKVDNDQAQRSMLKYFS